MSKAIFAKLIAFGLTVFLWTACEQTNSKGELGNKAITVLDANQTGVDFSNQLQETDELNIIEYLYYYNGGGVAVGDINNDGLEDIYFTANQGSDKLYLNKGNLQFEDITDQANIQRDATWSSGVAMEDLNNDGYLDIHVCKVGVGLMPSTHNLVYINQQDGTFKEMSEELGLAFQGFATQACFLDYDKDGDLDMYLLNHNVHSVRSYGTTDLRQRTDSVAGDRFYENRLNEEDQAFVDVTKATGIYSSPLGYGLAVACADINGDGWTDIYVGNDFHENDYLYLNNGDRTFTESIAGWTDHTTQFSMGVDIADINNDGLPDVFSTDMLPFQEEVYLKSSGEDTDQIKRIKADLGFENQYARNHLQLNTGVGDFMDLALQTRTFATDWSWAVLLQDFDNDGRKDIFISNGIAKRPNDLDYINYLNSQAIAQYAENDPERTRKLIEQLPEQKLPNMLFRQQAPLQFTSIAESTFGAPTFSNGAAYADLDGDGTLEIIVNNINEVASILTYQAATSTNYLRLSLNDPGGHTTKGAKVYVHAGSQMIHYQELQTVKGYQSSSSHTLHMGLGEITAIDSIVVIWPDQTKQLLQAPALNTLLEVQKSGEHTAKIAKSNGVTQPQFQLFPVAHEENKYVDDENEKLIPERLSREGPAVLHEDLDGDGIADLLLGGAHGQATRLLKGKRDGSFENLDIGAFQRDARYEDISAATIDFDGDGDRDIYIVSGGNDAKELDPLLEDRLYLNNGNMDFRRIPISLPYTNGSVVSVGDFDADGYEDIFVGARSIPGSYGLSPYSFIIRNLEGVAVDVAYKHRFGMVTDGEWVDYDNDKDLDLIICGDWMPITILKNEGEGVLNFLPEDAGFPQHKGFWRSLTFADVNADGRMDILAGNLGTNSLLRADTTEPVKLYLGDFDKNGYVDPIVFFPYFGRYVPLGSKDKYLSQLPGLKKRFVSYADFAAISDFEDLIPEAGELLVETKVVDELRSLLFLSTADGYKLVPFPVEMQALTIQDIHYDTETGAFFYLGSNQDLVAVRGNSMGTQLGRVASFDAATKAFGRHTWLSSPVDVDGRAIVPLDQARGIIVTNNSYPYLINLE